MEGFEREEYEQRISILLASWQQELDHLHARASERDMQGTVGDE